MAVSKVELANGEVLVDLTTDTVTPETLAEGVTAHGASGEKIVGTMPTSMVLYTNQTLTEEQKAQARENIGASEAEGEYELIETITIEEDGIMEILRKDCKYTALRVTMLAQPQGSVQVGAFAQATTKKGLALVTGSAYINNTRKYSSRCEIYKNGDVWDGWSTGNSFGWGGGNMLGMNNPGQLISAAKDDYISGVRLYTIDYGYPIGTVINIYGVRADA